jgi:hypothetical protein
MAALEDGLVRLSQIEGDLRNHYVYCEVIAPVAIGAVFFAIEATRSAQDAMFATSALFALSIIAAVVFLSWMRRVAA